MPGQPRTYPANRTHVVSAGTGSTARVAVAGNIRQVTLYATAAALFAVGDADTDVENTGALRGAPLAAGTYLDVPVPDPEKRYICLRSEAGAPTVYVTERGAAVGP